MIVVLVSRKPVTPETKIPVDNQLVSASNGFGFRLLKILATHSKDKNVFISPASMSLTLCMTYNGADGKTRKAMAETLGISKLSLQDINRACAALLANLTDLGPEMTLEIANSLWARKGVKFKPEFIDRSKEYYKADLNIIDFDSPEAVKKINSWVSNRTHGRIGEVIKRIDSNTILFLINALYFKGTWAEQFDPRDTHFAEFTLPDGFKKNVQMMFRHGKIMYLPGDGFAAVKLPYGKGRVNMYIFLPDKNTSLTQFLGKLDNQTWQKWTKYFHRVECDLSLPRFKIEYQSELKKALSALGMEIAFGDRADFKNMCLDDVLIKSVLHKTFVEVNEEGTEAAAATKVEIALKSAGPSIAFTVDRPFFCAIADDFTGEILFAGLILEPM
ncbi:MAG: serpin family protein [Armatimonadota bacterium]